jgi:integrase
MEAEWERLANVVTVTDEVAAKIVSAWAAALAAGEVKIEADGRASDVFEPLDLPEERTPARIAQMVEVVEPHVDEACRMAGMTITDDSRPVLFRAMIHAARTAYLDADLKAIKAPLIKATQPLDMLRELLPEPPQGAAPPRAALSLRGLFDAWKAVATVKPRTVDETEYAIQALIQHLGHEDAAKTSKADLIGWRDTLKAAGKSNNTWNNRHSLIAQVFKRAVDDGRLPSNPTNGLRLPKATAEDRFPYDDAEATHILTAARQETRQSRRWAHWIMAFTGMRVGEVLQLGAADIQQQDGIHYFVIEENAKKGKSVKTGERRHVPIHTALIKEGLLEYAATLPSDGPLFPDKKADKHGLRGTKGWQAVGRWVREKVGITDPDKVPNHSWRHRVEDELRAAGVEESIRDAITGHARKTTGRQYGVRGESLARLAEAVGRIPVPPGLGKGRIKTSFTPSATTAPKP